MLLAYKWTGWLTSLGGGHNYWFCPRKFYPCAHPQFVSTYMSPNYGQTFPQFQNPTSNQFLASSSVMYQRDLDSPCLGAHPSSPAPPACGINPSLDKMLIACVFLASISNPAQGPSVCPLTMSLVHFITSLLWPHPYINSTQQLPLWAKAAAPHWPLPNRLSM